MKVYKSSKMFIFRPDVLSLALGIFVAIFIFLLTLVSLLGGKTGVVAKPFETLFLGYHLSGSDLIWGSLWGFFYGYLLGFLIGYFYMVLMRCKNNKAGDEIFELYEGKKINIIQSGKGMSPYTIAIVANPIFLDHNGKNAKKDPIILEKIDWKQFLKNLGKLSFKIPKKNDPKLFFKVVIRILRSFANNELLRLPEIFAKIRFLAVFDPAEKIDNNNAYSLCKAYKEFPDDVIEARADESISFVKNRLKEEPNCAEDIDVIFVVSGSTDHIRSSAYYSEETTPGNSQQGDLEFELTTNSKSFRKFHCRRSDTPGVIALSAWDDRLKTPVHEFAHAMSSKENGVIVDEYIDQDNYGGQGQLDLPFIINKQHRATANSAVPKHFAWYRLIRFNKLTGTEVPEQEVEYFSDRDRCDKRPNEKEMTGWTSYVPARRYVNLSCIMDIEYSGCRFDDLLFDFMYDRLTTKVDRV